MILEQERQPFPSKSDPLCRHLSDWWLDSGTVRELIVSVRKTDRAIRHQAVSDQSPVLKGSRKMLHADLPNATSQSLLTLRHGTVSYHRSWSFLLSTIIHSNEPILYSLTAVADVWHALCKETCWSPAEFSNTCRRYSNLLCKIPRRFAYSSAPTSAKLSALRTTENLPRLDTPSNSNLPGSSQTVPNTYICWSLTTFSS
jgi:hypothetical protein